MAIDKDIKISIEEVSRGASVDGFGNMLYLTSAGLGADVTVGSFLEYSDNAGVTSDVKALAEVKTVANTYFGAWGKTPAKMLVGKYDSTDGNKVTDVFSKAVNEGKDFFIVVTDDTLADADATALAKLMDANKKLYFLQKGEKAPGQAKQGVALNHKLTAFASLNVKNLALFYGEGVKLAVVAASYLASTDLGEDASSFTLKFKQPSTVNASVLSSTQEQVLRDANINYLLEEFKNTRAIIKNGVMCDGTPIDKVQAVSYIRSKLQVDLFNYLTQNKKIGMNEVGFGLLERRLDSTLEGLVRSGILSKGQVPIDGVDTLVNNYKVMMPNANLLSPADRQLGVVKGVRIFLAYNYAVVELSLNVTI